MKKILLTTVFAVLAIFMSGCGNLSPRFDPKIEEKIDNQNGKIHEIENIQNGIKNELGNIKQSSDIQSSKLDHVQQGLANLQSSNSNTGVQIFSGPGGLFVGFCGLMLVISVIYNYRKTAVENAKAAEILAERIAKFDDPELEDDVMKSAQYTDVEGKVFSLLKKYQND